MLLKVSTLEGRESHRLLSAPSQALSGPAISWSMSLSWRADSGSSRRSRRPASSQPGRMADRQARFADRDPLVDLVDAALDQFSGSARHEPVLSPLPNFFKPDTEVTGRPDLALKSTSCELLVTRLSSSLGSLSPGRGGWDPSSVQPRC